MKLVLLRHGIAVDREDFLPSGKEDSLRPLTDKGRERTKKMAKLLKGWIEDFDMVVSSPYVRAMQTAEIVLPFYKKAELHECTELVPSAPPMALAQWLKVHAQTSTNVLAVGHEPQLSSFASWALAGAGTSFIDLRKSGIICLEIHSLTDVSAKGAILEWALAPRLF